MARVSPRWQSTRGTSNFPHWALLAGVRRWSLWMSLFRTDSLRRDGVFAFLSLYIVQDWRTVNQELSKLLTLSYNVSMATNSRRSRVFSISMPPEMAASAEALAKQENRSMSELLREAFRVYNEHQVARFIDEMGEYAKTRNPY